MESNEKETYVIFSHTVIGDLFSLPFPNLTEAIMRANGWRESLSIQPDQISIMKLYIPQDKYEEKYANKPQPIGRIEEFLKENEDYQPKQPQDLSAGISAKKWQFFKEEKIADPAKFQQAIVCLIRQNPKK